MVTNCLDPLEDIVVKAWRVHQYGAPREVLQLDDVEESSPGDGEIKIRVTSVTLNFNDLDGIHGRYKTVPRPVPYIPGMEVLGIVEECGTGAEPWLGHRVVAIPSGAFGGYAEYVVAPASMAFEMPDDMPEAEAAAIFMPFHLAWLALYERARVKSGETLLVHAGAGGAGSAALQLGVHAGARVFATAGSPDKTKLCLELGARLAINYRETDFVEAILDATDGRGVDVAFDAVGGDVTLKTFRCMAFNGRHILAGFASGIEQEDEGLVPRPVLFGNFSLVGVCHAYVDDPVVFKRLSGFNFPAHRDGEQLHAELLALFATRKLRAIVGLEVPFRELPAALDAMEQRQTVGRTVVRL
jgi:NADPH2:quinone reductase